MGSCGREASFDQRPKEKKKGGRRWRGEQRAVQERGEVRQWRTPDDGVLQPTR